MRKRNQTLYTNFNVRTNTSLYKNISLILYSRKGLMILSCVWDECRQGQATILTQLLLTIARCVIFKNPHSTSSASWLELLNRGSLRATAHSGLHVSNSQRPPASAYILLIRPLASPSSSAYLHRCFSDWRLGQGSIYNTKTITVTLLRVTQLTLAVNMELVLLEDGYLCFF